MDRAEDEEEMRCPQCHAEILEDDLFCHLCGASLLRQAVQGSEVRAARSCPRCGQPLELLDKFCGRCGADASASDKAAPVPPPPRTSQAPGLVVLLGYANIAVCLAAFIIAHWLLRSFQFSDEYWPYLLVRYAVLALLIGMIGFWIYLRTRRNQRDRRHARVIIVVSFVTAVAGVLAFI